MTRRPELRIYNDAAAAAQAAAAYLAGQLARRLEQAPRATLALSGGRSPWDMIQAWVDSSPPWGRIDIFQVDERAAPEGESARNLTALRTLLPPTACLHAMPVQLPEEQARAVQAEVLRHLVGDPPIFDLIHLGLGADGHTASLLPGDAALGVTDAPLAWSGPYQGHRRMTLTYPVLNAARRILFLVVGADKRGALGRLLAGDGTIPAGRVRNPAILIMADRTAAEGLSEG